MDKKTCAQKTRTELVRKIKKQVLKMVYKKSRNY